MIRSSNRKTKKFNKKGQKPPSKYETFQKPAKSWQGFIFRNIIIGLIIFLAVKSLYNNNQGYKWVYENLLITNLKMIKEHPEYTLKNKYEARLGSYAKYVNHIVENTPDSAIILMPPDSIIDSIDKKLNMNWLGSKRHTSYFLYPRKPIYFQNSFDSVYMDKITHVAIVNGYGYEHLKYGVKNKTKYTVAPLTIKKAE